MKRTLAILLLAACGEPSRGPVSIAFGEDACDACRMIVSEPLFAAQARFERSRVERYDDIGCLVRRLTSGGKPGEIWVVDHAGGEWIDARTAHYVRSKILKTPMASGLAAFASWDAAAAFAGARQGVILAFEELFRGGDAEPSATPRPSPRS